MSRAAAAACLVTSRLLVRVLSASLERWRASPSIDPLLLLLMRTCKPPCWPCSFLTPAWVATARHLAAAAAADAPPCPAAQQQLPLSCRQIGLSALYKWQEYSQVQPWWPYSEGLGR